MQDCKHFKTLIFMKKSFLVTFSITTRVIAEDEEQAMELAIDKVATDSQYVSHDNIDSVEEDTECPYDEFDEANESGNLTQYKIIENTEYHEGYNGDPLYIVSRTAGNYLLMGDENGHIFNCRKEELRQIVNEPISDDII